MNAFITTPPSHVVPVTCALCTCPQANTIRTDYTANNSLQMSDHLRLCGGQRPPSPSWSCPRSSSSGRVAGEAIRVRPPPAAGLLLFWLKQQLLCFPLLSVSRGSSATRATTQPQRHQCSWDRGRPVATDGIELSLCIMSPMKRHSGLE